MKTLRLPVRDPKKGYVTNNLIIPKKYVNVNAIKQNLTYVLQGEEVIVDEKTNEAVGTRSKQLELWDETAHHLIVPREFLNNEARRAFKVEWLEDRHDTIDADLSEQINFRDEIQEEAFRAMCTAHGGTLNLSCGKGKTVLALKYAATRNKPTLIIVNTTALMEQWLLEIQKHLGETKVGAIQGTEFNWRGCSIAVAMVHTLAYKRETWSMEFRRYWGTIFFDEAHHMSAPVFVRTADLFFGERFALTATAERTDGLESIYQYHLGRIIYSNLEQELIPVTHFHFLKWNVPAEDEPQIRDKTGEINLSKVRTYLGSLEWRNNLIAENIIRDMAEDRTVLVLSHSVEGVKALYAAYCNLAEPGVALDAGVIVGETDQKLRMPVLRESNPVFGTFQLAREGLDKPGLDTLYVTSPFANSNDMQQAWGRIQRLREGKKEPLVRVYEDSGINVSIKSCVRLRKYLKAWQYPTRKEKVEIEWE